MRILYDAVILLIAVGLAQAAAGLVLVMAFARRHGPAAASLPPVTILKPVCGEEILLEEAIASFCRQDYPRFQMVIGAQDPADPALAAARRAKARFPHCDIEIVVDATPHGANGKISNLMNMLPWARHDTLVIADSDLHVKPDYLRCVVARLAEPGTGLVTTAACGEAASSNLAGRLGASHISHGFLPGALMAEAAGRQDCLGGTMALTRETLARTGGLEALVDHLADDNVLGRLVKRLGLATRLATTLPVVTVQERSLGPLWQHEIRWARTIGSVAPLSFFFCVVQYPLFWALLAVLLSGAAGWSIGCLLVAWGARAAVVWGIDASLAARRARPARGVALWMLPLRDVLSVCEIVASFSSDVVVWRGRTLHARNDVAAYGRRRPEAVAAMVADDSLLSPRAPGFVSLARTS
jgi:ceramide glucosyltransferase